MQEIILLLSAVITFTLIYKVYPFKQWKTDKPKFVIFPKYIAKYLIETESVIINIKAMGFELKDENSNIFVRGKAYGDFSVKWMKLEVQLNKEKEEIKVFSPFFGIVFDNGDLWEITSKAIGSTKTKYENNTK